MAVADIYDALISQRVYKSAIPHEVAVEMIENEHGKHLDPDVVDAFLDLQEIFRNIAPQVTDITYPSKKLVFWENPHPGNGALLVG
jgi:putative two-component system response regulator